MKAAVLGAGSWATALASVLCDNDYEATLWARDENVACEINETHTNSRYVPNATLPVSMSATTNLVDALRGAELLVYAVPSRAARPVAQMVAPLVGPETLIAHAVKGFDAPSLDRISVMLSKLHRHHQGRVCVISGPSHAEEVMAKLPTVLVAASEEPDVRARVQHMFMNPYFRVYTQSDVVGVELGGSLKNIIALAIGIVDGLGFGDNAKAAVMTRGLAEIARLGKRLGAKESTFAGLTGVGDLIATCTSSHSRNLRAGRLMGQGVEVGTVEARVGMVVEGIPAVDAALKLSRQFGVEMPITSALHAVLHDGMNPADAAEDLMERERRHESEVEGPSDFW